ncbi:hypothetical protein NX059_009585 [Plenodomus lindquistii]|nr:hypothetical protein NX059_009585 [Plenodomus lindquistii]
MRYDDWDVILFPRDSPVPIQEFKTACFVSPDEGNSLPPSTPFRISIHSWATAAKPSAIIEAQRKPDQKVVYKVNVVVDGAKAFRGFFDIASKWPQEIAHEKRSLASVEQPTSQKKPCLEFPPFDIQKLMQTSWNPRDPSTRIKIIISEQLIGRTDSPGELDLGAACDIVCFSFQHAPKDVLEQAGISWPIRNPLYLPTAHERFILPREPSPTLPCAPRIRDPALYVHMQSPLSHRSKPTGNRQSVPDPHRGPRSHLPAVSRLPKLTNTTRATGRQRLWNTSFQPLGDDGDDASMGTWSTRRIALNSTSDVATPDYMFASSQAMKQHSPWTNASPVYEPSANMAHIGHQARKETGKSNTFTFRDDQLGQIIHAISPPKNGRKGHYSFGSQHNEPLFRPPTAHAYYPPKIGRAPPMARPSSASMARTSSYPDLNSALRNVSTNSTKGKPDEEERLRGQSFPAYPPTVSSNKENRPPSQGRMPTPMAFSNRVATPHALIQGLPAFDPDLPTKDLDSTFPSQPRFDLMVSVPPTDTGKVVSAHGPSGLGKVRSRKEGLVTDLPQEPQQSVRHDQSLLPPIGDVPTSAQRPVSQERAKHMHKANTIPATVEIIDVDAIGPQLAEDVAIDTAKLSPFKATHRAGMSSVDSTRRLEQQLYNALGEELGSFEERIDANGMGPELARAIGGSASQSDFGGSTLLNPSVDESEPVVKRKRQGTLGGERDRSPLTKREKANLVEVEEVERRVVPSLRGD